MPLGGAQKNRSRCILAEVNSNFLLLLTKGTKSKHLYQNRKEKNYDKWKKNPFLYKKTLLL